MKNRKKRISSLLEIPEEISNNETKITLVSFNEMLIENYKGISEYEEFFIRINTELGTINVNGYNLQLEQITNEDLLVKGKIESIGIERKEE